MLSWDYDFEWIPKADISETDSLLKIKMNVPDVKAENIKIELTDSSLSVSGKTEEVMEEKGESWYRNPTLETRAL